jgi:uncharacterized RmlC-like cupin family protein
MKRLSGRLGVPKLIAVTGAGVLLAAGLGVAGASAADQSAGGTRATSVAMLPCALKYAPGSLYVGSDDAVYKVSQQTGDATGIVPQLPRFSAFNAACGVAVDGAGNLLVADGPQVVAVAAKTGSFYGRKMVKGRAYLIATGFEGAGAVDVQLDPAGNVVIAVGGAQASHTNNEQDSQIIVLAERTGTFYGKRMVKGKLYVVAGVLNGGPSASPCDGPDAAAANAAAPAAAAKATQATKANLGYTIGTIRFDAEGNIILADSGGDGGSPCGADAYDVPPVVAVIPARTGSYYGQKMTVGDIYPIAGLGKKTANGVPAVDSDLATVSAVALDHAGNVLIATGSEGYIPGSDQYSSATIRVIAAKTGTFYGQKMIKGDLYALPGLGGTSAVAVDSAGNVLAGNITYSLVHLLAEKTGAYYGVKARAGHIYTIAGNGKEPA